MIKDSLDNQPTLTLTLLIQAVPLDQELDILLQKLQGNPHLGRVHQDSSNCERTHRSDIPTLSTLGLYHKHPVPTGRGTLFDGITSFYERIERGIGTERKVCEGYIVRQGRWEMNHGDLEGGVVGSVLREEDDRVESFETTNDQQAVQRVSLETGSDGADIDGR